MDQQWSACPESANQELGHGFSSREFAQNLPPRSQVCPWQVLKLSHCLIPSLGFHCTETTQSDSHMPYTRVKQDLNVDTTPKIPSSPFLKMCSLCKAMRDCMLLHRAYTTPRVSLMETQSCLW